MYCRLLAAPSQSVHLSANNIVLKVRQPTGGQQYFTVITAARQTPLYNIIHTHTAQLREMLSVQSNTTYVVFIHRYRIHKGNEILTTPWSTVHPEELGGPQLVKKFPTFYATQIYLTAFTNDHHLSLS